MSTRIQNKEMQFLLQKEFKIYSQLLNKLTEGEIDIYIPIK